jgi:hypothetical protein
MCEYCHEDNTEESLRGDDGIYYNQDNGRYYLYVEHFLNEKYRIEVEYCPKCGKKLR